MSTLLLGLFAFFNSAVVRDSYSEYPQTATFFQVWRWPVVMLSLSLIGVVGHILGLLPGWLGWGLTLMASATITYRQLETLHDRRRLFRGKVAGRPGSQSQYPHGKTNEEDYSKPR